MIKNNSLIIKEFLVNSKADPNSYVKKRSRAQVVKILMASSIYKLNSMVMLITQGVGLAGLIWSRGMGYLVRNFVYF